MAGALLFDEKIRQSAPLFWFELRDVGILYTRAVTQRTNDVCRIFGAQFGGKDRKVHANRDPNKQEVGLIFT